MAKVEGIKLACGILKWAIGSISIDELIQKFPKIESWLNETELPTFNQLQKLATYLDFPFGYFFLSNPIIQPEVDDIDFRTIKNKLKDNLSKNLQRNISNMQYLQEWKKDYCIRNQLDKIDLKLPATYKDTPELLSQYIYSIKHF
ncbi:MAG: hypothetical protein ACTTKH_00385 [Treponema sp.]